ncbi:MAG: hypothetical protein OXE82_08740 [Rhodobacter sp.]|nr:hypothetical protein [Rhodobacter sp.]
MIVTLPVSPPPQRQLRASRGVRGLVEKHPLLPLLMSALLIV